jgi:hypothetical protein
MSAAAMGCLTEAVQPAMIGIDVLLPETGEAHGQQEAATTEHAPQTEDADVSARTAPRGRGRAGRAPAIPSGSRAAVLQRRALRRAAAAAPDASRSRPGRAARAIPRTHTQERRAAFSALREQYGFSEYAFHELARELRVSWLAEHLDAVLAQTLATRAYQALNRVCVGKARRVRFKSRGRGLSSIENKRNDTGLRFVVQTQDKGRGPGYLLWHDDQLEALIDWDDPVVTHGLSQRIKYARLLRRRASSPRAQGADREGERYFVQLILAGMPHHKPKHSAGTDKVGLDLGPASIAIVPREAEARLEPLCAELRPDARAIRRLQRRMDRQRRILSTTTTRAGPRNAAKALPAGSRAGATRLLGDAKRPESASWPPTARACMADSCTRSWPWATP